MTTLSRWLRAVPLVALAVLDLRCSESDSLTGPAPGPGLVFARGIVRRRTLPYCYTCVIAGAVVTVQGDGINVSTESGADGRFQLPPFKANVPIVLTCTWPGHSGSVTQKHPHDGYAPRPGTETDWECSFDVGAPGR